MNNQEKKIIINKVFAHTDLDELFIEVAISLGYAAYFSDLKDLDAMTDDELDICFNRVVDVATRVNRIVNEIC